MIKESKDKEVNNETNAVEVDVEEDVGKLEFENMSSVCTRGFHWDENSKIMSVKLDRSLEPLDEYNQALVLLYFSFKKKRKEIKNNKY